MSSKQFLKLFLLYISVVYLGSTTLSAAAIEQVPPDRPELQLPLFSKKMVIAHNMTEEVNRYATGIDLDLYSLTGSTSNLGGLHQYLQYDAVLFSGKSNSLEEKCDQEIKEAIFCGLDGFQFYYPEVREDAFMRQYTKVIKAHLKVADQKYPNFKITLCFYPSGKIDINSNIDFYVTYVKELISETKDYQSWLKTPDGRTIFYTWIGDNILSELGGKHYLIKDQSELLAKVAWALEEIGLRSGVKPAIIHHLRFPENPTYVENFWKYFAGGWNWTTHTDSLPDLIKAAELGRAKKRMYSFTLYPDFYTSKIFKQGTWEMFFDATKAVAYGKDHLTRHYQNTGLSDVYLSFLKEAIKKDSQLISFATWNDFREGQHLAPEINHNFVPALLLKYYKNVWQGASEPIEKETVMVMFKKYASTITPEPYDISIATNGSFDKYPPAPNEDGLDIITLLKTSGTIFYNGIKVGEASPGPQVLKIPIQKGKVAVTIKRGDVVVCTVTPPEWRTEKPYRTDKLTYMFSSRCEELFHTLYGNDQVMPVSDEYAETIPGLPNWQKRLSQKK